jgi:hypothetical protein
MDEVTWLLLAIFTKALALMTLDIKADFTVHFIIFPWDMSNTLQIECNVSSLFALFCVICVFMRVVPYYT